MNNELIARLSAQALDYAAEQYGTQRAGEKVWMPVIYERKFTELIIQECNNVIQDQSEDHVDDAWDRGYAMGLCVAMSTLIEHFELQS